MLGTMVKIKKLYEDAQVPCYANKGDAGADLYSYENVIIEPRQFVLVSTGISLAMPVRWVGLVHPRSGLAAKHGITVLNSPGTVDSGYRGEIKVNLINLSDTTFAISKGDRIAQIVFQQVEQADFLEVDSLEATERGIWGHGSTGGFNNG